MAYNYNKLLGRIVEKFDTQSRFAKDLGLSEHTLSKKLNNQVHWKQCEISKACELLGIKKEDIHEYFFTQEVQLN